MGFAKRLKEARHRSGLTGPELAAKLGVVRSAVAQYETGRSYPSIPVLKKMTRLLGISTDWLLFDECEAAAEIQDKELAAFVAKADLLGYQERAHIKGIIDGLLARMELEALKQSSGKPKRVA